MSLVYILFASVLAVFWLMFFFSAPDTAALKITLEKIFLNSCEIEKKKNKILQARKKLENADRFETFLTNVVFSEKSEIKEINRLMREDARLKTGKLKITELLPLAGYTMLSMFKIDSEIPFFKALVEQNTALANKNVALDRTRYQVSCSLSYAIGGMAVAAALAALLNSMGMSKQSLMVGGIGVILACVLAYLPLDGLKEKVDKRQDDITSDFPQAVSKLTLLVGSGIDVSQAWKQTAESNFGTLYSEMAEVIHKMENGISPLEAYNEFIFSCNNKFTSKLGTAITQNLQKGNDEICLLLNDIAAESWTERRHFAKRKGELAQSKLMVPIMLMFGGIIILVIAPVMSGFGGMGL